jgi:hypothetical protein
MLYTYCKNTGEIIGLLEFEQQPQFSTTKLYDGNFIKPMLNFATDEFYEGATAEEIAAALKLSIPDEVPLWRIRAILATLGKEDEIFEAINSLPDPPKTAALYVWNYGTVIERNSNTVAFIQQVLQMNDTEVDDIFLQAVNIEV